MPIITIFGSTFGEEEEFAREVAKSLGYPFAGREILVAASQRAAVPEAKLNDLLEKEPGWWERWQENLRPYRIALQAAMTEAALSHELVYLGHVGHGLLPGIPHVLRVLLIAPMDYRIEQLRLRQGLDERASRRYIGHVEKAWSHRLLAMFGTDWQELGQYALILNAGQMSPSSARDMIAAAAALMQYQATTKSRQMLADMALAAKVEAYLLTYPSLRNLNIAVKANQGHIILSGLIPPSLHKGELRHVVETIPGVKRVVTDLLRIESTRPRYGYG